jgi:hypothetical protein
MPLTMQELTQFADSALQQATEACLERYKANRNPMLAALYDPVPETRAGAAFLLAYMLEEENIITENTLPVLRERIRTEKHVKAKVIMEAMYERIQRRIAGGQ